MRIKALISRPKKSPVAKKIPVIVINNKSSVRSPSASSIAREIRNQEYRGKVRYIQELYSCSLTIGSWSAEVDELEKLRYEYNKD